MCVCVCCYETLSSERLCVYPIYSGPWMEGSHRLVEGSGASFIPARPVQRHFAHRVTFRVQQLPHAAAVLHASHPAYRRNATRRKQKAGAPFDPTVVAVLSSSTCRNLPTHNDRVDICSLHSALVLWRGLGGTTYLPYDTNSPSVISSRLAICST